eukprot:Hpha_TRINITY_DN12095_c0_g1::TRINITY_DN12095_c0_g1_i2::g.140945::m.140945
MAEFSRVHRDRESRKLRYNDKVSLLDLQTGGYLTLLGINHRDVGVHIPCPTETGDGVTPEMVVQRRDKRNGNFGKYMFDILPFDADTEDPVRLREVATMRSEVCYGEKIKLRHTLSQGFLSVPSIESPVSSGWYGENDNMKISFISRGEEEPESRSVVTTNCPEVCFKITPSYRVRQEGQAIHTDDEILLQHAELRPLHFVHTGRQDTRKQEDEGDEVGGLASYEWKKHWREANLSLRDTATTYVVRVFEAMNRDPEGAWLRNMTQQELVDRYSRRDRLLKAGDPVLLYHQDHDGYFNIRVPQVGSAEREATGGEVAADFTLECTTTITEKLRGFSSNSFFSFELQDTNRGGIIALDRAVRIRHAASSMYLGHRLSSNESRSPELCLVDNMNDDELDQEGGHSTLWMPTEVVHGEDVREIGQWEEEIPNPPEGRLRNDKTYRFAGVTAPMGRTERPYVVQCWLGTSVQTNHDVGRVTARAHPVQRFQDAIVVMLAPDQQLVHDVIRLAAVRPVLREWQEWWRQKDVRAEQKLALLMKGQSHEMVDPLLAAIQKETPGEVATRQMLDQLKRITHFLSPPDLEYLEKEKQRNARANIRELFRFSHVERHTLHKKMMLEQDLHRELLECVTVVLNAADDTELTVKVTKIKGQLLRDALPLELESSGKVKKVFSQSRSNSQNSNDVTRTVNPEQMAMRRKSWVLSEVQGMQVSGAGELERIFQEAEVGATIHLKLTTTLEGSFGRNQLPLSEWTQIAWKHVVAELVEGAHIGGWPGVRHWPEGGRFNYLLFHPNRVLESNQQEGVSQLQEVLLSVYRVLYLLVKDHEESALAMAADGFIDIVRDHLVWHRVGADACLAEILKHQSVLTSPHLNDRFFERCADDWRLLSDADGEASRRLVPLSTDGESKGQWSERDSQCVAVRLVQ